MWKVLLHAVWYYTLYYIISWCIHALHLPYAYIIIVRYNITRVYRTTSAAVENIILWASRFSFNTHIYLIIIIIIHRRCVCYKYIYLQHGYLSVLSLLVMNFCAIHKCVIITCILWSTIISLSFHPLSGGTVRYFKMSWKL